MKNLINAISNEKKQQLNDFIKDINKITTVEKLDTWQYNDLLPKGKKMGILTLTQSVKEVKAYLIKRKEQKIYKSIEEKADRIKQVFTAGEMISVKISVEWKKSRTWGANPTAEAWITFKNKEGHNDSHYIKTAPIGGCGYDKLSTAVAKALNTFDEVLKPLYTLKNKKINTDNRTLIGYGSGYGILPYLEGGVGVSCYPRIFEAIGYKFETVASGKTFDVFQITKK